jgi:3'-phosphoadenosine 5'-phosphosulfate sulfotransferase (PAPS reductase)/FAD synthetase
MITDKPNTEHGNGTNTLLPAVAPTLTLSTDTEALDGGQGLSGLRVGATSKDDLIRSSKEIFTEAVRFYKPRAIVGMFSGGDDSLTMLHVAQELGIKFTAIIHGDTKTGIPQTTDFAKAEVSRLGHRLIIADAGTSYVDYVMRKGFFGKGNGAHAFSYNVLKANHFKSAVSNELRKGRSGYRVLFINGARRLESERRKKTMVSPYRVENNKLNIWVNLINEWDKHDTVDYLEGNNIQRNPVSIKLCRSGECMCGTMQTEGDRTEASYFFPEWGKWLDELEKAVKEKHGFGWNDTFPKKMKEAKETFQPMCTGCKVNYQAHLDFKANDANV